MSSTAIVTLVATRFFKTFPCSAERGTVEPPVVKSSTIADIGTLVFMSVVLTTIAAVLAANKAFSNAISALLSNTSGVSCVFTANNAKGTAVKGALLISIKFEQLSSALNSIFKFLVNKLHLMSSKDKA